MRKGVSPLHSLINARQEMFDNVYWHHANRACMIMLLRAVQDALLAGAVTGAELTHHDDRSLLALLRQPEMPAATRRLTAALDERRIYKRAVEFSNRARGALRTHRQSLFRPGRAAGRRDRAGGRTWPKRSANPCRPKRS